MSEPVSLTELSYDELVAWITGLGEPPFRAAQVFQWIHHLLAAEFSAMTNLPADLRQRLTDLAVLKSVRQLESITSADGLTTKVLLQLFDGESIETVLMHYQGRHTVCVSTQVGCPVACAFCVTGQSGFKRNLSSGEIVDQVLHFARQLHEQLDAAITNVVLMGMGEPLLNYEATLKAIRIVNDPRGMGIGARRFTVSTAGVVPGIRRLAGEGLELGLAVSLHAADNELRNRLVPLNKRYPVSELIAACREYIHATGRRVTFEYALIETVNDTIQHARDLAGMLRNMQCHVNLIPCNPNLRGSFRPSSRERVLAFRAELNRLRINNTVRLERGIEIRAGCGQLRSRTAGEGAIPG